MTLIRQASVVALALLASGGAAQASVVYSNNNSPGDVFTNAGGSNTNPLTPGAAIGASGWFYNNVRNNGIVGVHDNLPRSGNGSARMQSTQGPGGASSKADLEYFHQAATGTFGLGTLGAMNSLSYDWYKKGTSAASQHAVIRLYIDGDGIEGTTTDRGYLVFERAYNGGVIPTDQWVTDDLFSYAGGGAKLWQVAFGIGNFDTAGNWQPISVWQSPGGFTPSPNGKTFSAASVVYGLSLGVGSGWDTYDGAVDNVTIGFTGAPVYSWNFEVVPAPASAAFLGLGGLVVAGRRRRTA
ncbi:MAG: hypothetical protein IT439_04225 [Phycisphaerales bacterium]|nr:hypothetical protein [Phycisphaerales bacterium]